MRASRLSSRPEWYIACGGASSCSGCFSSGCALSHGTVWKGGGLKCRSWLSTISLRRSSPKASWACVDVGLGCGWKRKKPVVIISQSTVISLFLGG